MPADNEGEGCWMLVERLWHEIIIINKKKGVGERRWACQIEREREIGLPRLWSQVASPKRPFQSECPRGPDVELRESLRAFARVCVGSLDGECTIAAFYFSGVDRSSPGSPRLLRRAIL